MSQRNPMNDRYQQEHKGQTKKSAASAKPKSRAANSVYVKTLSNKDKKKLEKERRRQEREKQREMDRLFYNPPTPRYKKLRKIWWGCLAGAVVFTLLGMFVGGVMLNNDIVTFALITPGYVCIFVALWLDFTKIQNERRAYQALMRKEMGKEAKKASTANVKKQKKTDEPAFAELNEKPKFMQRFEAKRAERKAAKEAEASDKDE